MSSGSSESGSGSEYDSEDSDRSSEGSESGNGDEEEEDAVEAGPVSTARQQRIRADIDEMRRMMADMDAIKMRLQQRVAAERQARTERLAREDHDHEVQDAARHKAGAEARSRQVEASVQTEGDIVQQQMQLSQRNVCPPHLADSVRSGAGTLPAVDRGQGFTDMVPTKVKPAGLSLYDLVKTSGFDLSRKIPSPVRQADPPEVLPMRSSHERVSPEQQQFNDERQKSGGGQDWHRGGSQLSIDQDSVVGDGDDDVGYITRRQDASISSTRSYQQRSEDEQSVPLSPHYDDENLGSVSNSLVSSDASNRSSVVPDLNQRQDHKFNAATLLSTASVHYRPPPSTSTAARQTSSERWRRFSVCCSVVGEGAGGTAACDMATLPRPLIGQETICYHTTSIYL